jgi:Putative auto-transporter adhesin, head GIN domain
MKKNYIILAIVFALILVGGFFAFRWIRTTFFDGLKRDLPTFSKIYSNIPYNIVVQNGPKERIEITGDNKYGDKIDFEVVSGELKLKNNPRVPVERNGPQILIYKKNLEAITLANKGDARIDTMSGNEIDLESKDKGNIIVDSLTSKTLVVTVRDSGDITASGKADAIEANIVNSSGKINLVGVEAPTAKKKDVGTGTVKFNPNTVVEGEEKTKKK